jgi:hypothetical protein
MKAFIRGEVFTDDFRQELHLVRSIFDSQIPGFGTALFSWPSDTWAAEIVGFDKKYKYQRIFLRGKKDYTYANGKGSRGIYLEWILESGHIYDIKRRVSWSRCERFFCTVTENGDIERLDEKDVIECLKRRSALMCLPPPGSESLMCLTTSRESMYRLAGEKTAR